MAGEDPAREAVLQQWSEGSWSFLSPPQWAAQVADLVRAVAEERWHPQWQRLTAGRDFVVVVSLGEQSRGVVRPYRRGGWMRLFSERTYLGVQPRSFHELRCLLELARRGVPVVSAIGAAARWSGRWRYQAWLVTGFIEGSHTLWEWLRGQPPAPQRQEVLTAVARALVQLHRAGGLHRDLNLKNILVRVATGPPEVWLIDFDAADIRAAATDPERSLARLRRSARRLDPQESYGALAAVELVAAAAQELWSVT